MVSSVQETCRRPDSPSAGCGSGWSSSVAWGDGVLRPGSVAAASVVAVCCLDISAAPACPGPRLVSRLLPAD